MQLSSINQKLHKHMSAIYVHIYLKTIYHRIPNTFERYFSKPHQHTQPPTQLWRALAYPGYALSHLVYDRENVILPQSGKWSDWQELWNSNWLTDPMYIRYAQQKTTVNGNL